MAGMMILSTRILKELQAFYVEKVGMELYEVHEDLVVLRHDNLLVGLRPSSSSDSASGTLHLWVPSPQEVDQRYSMLKPYARGVPEWSTSPRAYGFTAQDPEGRALIIQYQPGVHFPFFMSDRLLVTRRSIREFTEDPVPDDLLWKIFELSRFAPTSRNSQSYTYWVIRDRGLLDYLGQIRKESDPISRAPMAIAITADPQKSKRYEQDAVIAAYHLMLAAWTFGLGTCWIAAMNRPDVKEALGIPMDHYVATVTPLGFPKFVPEAPPRRPAEAMVRFVNAKK